MLKLSRLSDYAVLTLRTLQTYGDTPVAASVLAQETHLPEPTVAKILKLLAIANLASSTRGVKGGYKLALPLEQISIKDVINALDGPIALTACVSTSEEGCDLAHKCAMHGRWEQVNKAIKDALEGVSIADMVGGNDKRLGF